MAGAYLRLDSSDPSCAAWNAEPACAQIVLRCEGPRGRTTLLNGGEVVREFAEPLAGLRWLDRHAATLDRGQRWIGFFSYDLGRLFEVVSEDGAADAGWPLYAFGLHTGDGRHERRADWRGRAGAMRSNFSPDGYRAAVGRVLEYIRAGDVFQVNLSQRFVVPQTMSAGEIYQRLLQRSPATFGGLLEFDDLSLICNSPELFLRVMPQSDGTRRVFTRPIKGTRPALPGMEAALRDSVKDQAELNMIVDLERNDLGRVCEIGSVRVTQPRRIESHPTVLHAVAEVAGTLRKDVGLVELLAATFPGGSVTGAPKIRAMQIIDELEPVRRGPYCGAIGWIGAGGAMEWNIAIRTMLVRDGYVHIPVGGGIVADSDPQAEYDETLVKARAMFDALGVERT